MHAITSLCLVVLLAGCGSLPKNVERIPSYALNSDGNTTLGRDIQRQLDQHPRQSGFYTLRFGEEAFAARLRLIMAAEESIDAQYYIWHDDLTGSALHQELLAAADRGVRVRLLLDDLDTAGKDRLLRTIDAHKNIEVRLFNPFANRQHRARDLITDTRRINRRMHNKTITADNIVSIFGGRNIGDEYFAAAAEVGFGDMDALAIGPIAKEVSSQFDLYWNSKWAYPIAAFEWSDTISAEDVTNFQQQAQQQLAVSLESEYADVVRQFDITAIDHITELPFVYSEWLLAYDQPSKVEATVISVDTHLAPKLKAGMDKTQNDLIIVSPYFVPGEEFTEYLVGLVARGVRVRILTNSLAANDVALVHAGYMRYRKTLVAGGIELFEFKAKADASLEEKSKEKAHIGASKASLHAKFFGFDKTHLFIGSFNLDGRSAALNTELGAYFASPKHAVQLSDAFDQRMLNVAYRLDLNADNNLVWTTMEKGREVRIDTEPDTTGWERFKTRMLSIIVPESQL